MAKLPMVPSLEVRVDPALAALLVVDVQNDYCHRDGALGAKGFDVTPHQAPIPYIQRLVDGARKVGVPVIFLRNAHEPFTESEAWLGVLGKVPGPDAAVNRPGIAGSWGAEAYEIQPRLGEPVVHKQRYSGFVGTRLDTILRTTRRSSVILTGVATNVCVESTARHALFLDYHVVMVSDATATHDGPEAQQATLNSIARHFGLVASTEEILRCWGVQAAPRAEAELMAAGAASSRAGSI